MNIFRHFLFSRDEGFLYFRDTGRPLRVGEEDYQPLNDKLYKIHRIIRLFRTNDETVQKLLEDAAHVLNNKIGLAHKVSVETFPLVPSPWVDMTNVLTIFLVVVSEELPG